MHEALNASFRIGQEVVTRRGKRGTVVELCADGETLNVRFGGKVFPMRWSQVVTASAYDRMGRGYSRQMYQ